MTGSQSRDRASSLDREHSAAAPPADPAMPRSPDPAIPRSPDPAIPRSRDPAIPRSRGLRVLLVGPYPPPFGGIASHIVNLIPALLERGVEDVAVVAFGDTEAVLREHGATLYKVNARVSTKRLFASPAAVLATLRELGDWRLGARRLLAEAVRTAVIAQIADQHRSSVVSFYQSNESLPLLPLRRLWGRTRGLLLTVFGEFYDTPDFFRERAPQMGRQLDAADARLSSSKHCARSFQSIGLDHPIEAVYYGVELERFDVPQLRDSWRAGKGIGPDDVLVTYMGRFSEQMGLDRVLEVVPDLLAQHPRLRIALAGARGPLTDAAGALAAAHGNRVLTMTNVPFAEQPGLYAGSDVVLAPTRDQHACMGMSIKEAMAAGRAVVASNAGGIPEAVVDGMTGILVPLDETLHVDRHLFGQAIGQLTADAALRDRMGAAARARAHEIFSNDRTVNRVLQVMTDIQPATRRPGAAMTLGTTE
jgi:glycosyltransferase involved in cell wall biosynthesis